MIDAFQRQSLIGFDTSIFIYLIEDAPRYADIANDILDELTFGRQQGVTSVLTLTELIVRPLVLGRIADADEYVETLRRFPNLEIAEITEGVALRAAALRANYRIATPDALQIAACLLHGATAFVTNDRRLRRVEELHVVVLDDLIDSTENPPSSSR